MTRGLSHITDHSNASRTLLYDLALRNWSPALCDLFGVPIDALPEIVASYGRVAMTDPRTFQGLEIPIAGIAGDQQSALFGQGCFNPGSSKCTYGTGAFVLVNTGDTPAFSDTGLLTTVAWGHPDGRIDYALEGSVFVAGAAVQWLRDGLGLISSSQQTEELASSVPDSGGVVFVPALTGLGAPAWDPFARGMIIGITRGTTRAHIVRATLEGIAFQVSDVVDLFVDAGHRQIVELAVDGGAAQNNLLCQIQADQLQIPVCRTSVLETTGLGAAFLAGLGIGVWSSTDELAAIRRVDRTFAPSFTSSSGGSRRSWRDAVERSRGWARDEQIEG
jgi:glycerol kinase